MRIVIDMQGAQAESLYPGFSSYVLEFVKAVVRSRGDHEVILVLSDLFPETIKTIRAEFVKTLSSENIRLCCIRELQALNNLSDVVPVVYLDFLKSLQPDVVHFTDPTFLKADFFKSVKEITPLFNITGFECNYSSDGIPHLSLARGDLATLSRLSAFCSTASNVIDDVNQSFDVWKKLELDSSNLITQMSDRKLRLANVSPLPPERSGIADYSAELLPFLSQFYEIDVITDQQDIDCVWIKDNCRILSTNEFMLAASDYDRIVYHFGNNPMHVQMFDLLLRYPGIVVLHDFFLSGVQWYRETYGFSANALWSALYESHGYNAVQERAAEQDEPVVFRYPCNFDVIKNAVGVIAHSENTLRLAKQWYGIEDGLNVIPLLRHKADQIKKSLARKQLGISSSDFLVCSFGFIGKTKHNHSLLDAWENSAILSGDKSCKLVFVGDTDESLYSVELINRVKKYSDSGSVKISGWTDAAIYRLYLAAADVAVQLRTLSRGETSAAVLDCMNYGIATIVNANGSMADISAALVRKIPDEFSIAQLRAELEYLHSQPQERLQLAKRAQYFLHTEHAPAHCAQMYASQIENFYAVNIGNVSKVVQRLRQIMPVNVDKTSLITLAEVLSENFPSKKPAKRLFLDVSVVARDDFKTGIQRVVRSLTTLLHEAPPEGYRIEPVYLVEENTIWHYRYARNYMLGLLNLTQGWLEDEPIEAQAGDILLGLDLAGGYVVNANRQGLYRKFQELGVQVSFVVYDLIPIQFENIYPPGFKEGHADWLKVVANADSAICISQAVASDLKEWIAENVPERKDLLKIDWFHLGADIDTSCPTKGLPENAGEIIGQIKRLPSFLMVGTVEPRKGHAQALEAFEFLWAQDVDVNLVVVGKEGWMVEELACRFRQHSELGKRLFWLEAISDEYLLKVYESSVCLLAASLGEGFGLPLIEAAQHKVPIIVRDMPVFREVAGDHAFYFDSKEPEGLASSIKQWLELYQQGKHPRSDNMPWLTWEESSQQLLAALINK